ncbi:methyltransferase [Fragilaria crotonensis]|nr:methyltransferase [Fragilaria crotonensis]
MPAFTLRLCALSAFLSSLVVVECQFLRPGHADPKTITQKCLATPNVPYLSVHGGRSCLQCFLRKRSQVRWCYRRDGGFDGKTFSNSWFFQYALNWRALLVEAFPDNYAKMVVNRPDATNVFGAICPGKSISFQPAKNGATGGAAQDMSDIHKDRFVDASAALVEVPCMMLSELFQKNEIDHVDLFYLDVEGGELTVLETFDWSVPIDMFVIEMDGTNVQKDEAVRQLLRSHGYVTPFSMLDECRSQRPQCMPSEIFVLREISESKYVKTMAA